MDFMKKLESLLNDFSRENESNTPDFIMAEFMAWCLDGFNKAVKRRDQWYSIHPEPGWSNPDNRMREAIGATYAKACIFADEGKDIRQIEFPIIADEVIKGLTGKTTPKEQE